MLTFLKSFYLNKVKFPVKYCAIKFPQTKNAKNKIKYLNKNKNKKDKKNKKKKRILITY